MNESASSFEKDLWKLMKKCLLGKTDFNIRGRVNVKMLNNTKKQDMFSKPDNKDQVVFNDNLIAIKQYLMLYNIHTKYKFDKPASFLMYYFYYEY